MALGLKKGTVKLVPFNPKWQGLFEEEKQLLLRTFGDIIVAIEHIGSTAISGIPAKPILDLDVAVKSLSMVKAMKDRFEQLGYEYRGHQGEEERELFVKGPPEKRTHHVHVTTYDSNFWINDLLFRDFLRKNAEIARQYGKLKMELVIKFADDRSAYTDQKRIFQASFGTGEKVSITESL